MDDERVEFGSDAWLQVVHEETCNGIRRNPPPPGFQLSFMERFHDGPPGPGGSVFGYRIEISGEDVSFRTGVSPVEEADIIIDADYEAVRILTHMLKTDARYPTIIDQFVKENKFSVTGKIADAGAWLTGCHDAIVKRTV